MTQTILKDGRILSIRKAREDDAEQLVDYINLVGGESGFLTFGKDGCRYSVEEEKQFLRNLGDNPANLYLVGFVGDELACCANLASQGKKRVAHNCEFGITVKKKYWHLGAASALLAELIDFARKDPVLEMIHLGVYENNERAIRLYEKFGFEKVGRHKRFFRIGDEYYDEILMDLDLRGS